MNCCYRAGTMQNQISYAIGKCVRGNTKKFSYTVNQARQKSVTAQRVSKHQVQASSQQEQRGARPGGAGVGGDLGGGLFAELDAVLAGNPHPYSSCRIGRSLQCKEQFAQEFARRHEASRSHKLPLVLEVRCTAHQAHDWISSG